MELSLREALFATKQTRLGLYLLENIYLILSSIAIERSLLKCCVLRTTKNNSVHSEEIKPFALRRSRSGRLEGYMHNKDKSSLNTCKQRISIDTLRDGRYATSSGRTAYFGCAFYQRIT
jgi:hypothetical protein